MKDKRKINAGERFFRELTFKRDSINEEKRSVDVSFSSETDQVIRWGEPEILDHAPGAANLTRLNSIGVVLFNHNPNVPIGRIENARIENGRGLATLIFDDDDDSDKIFRKVVSGTLKGISVSYSYQDYSFLGDNETSADGRFKGPCLLVKRWTALEISVVSVPADASVGIGRSLEERLEPLIEKMVRECIEKRAEDKPPTDDNPPDTPDDKRSLELYQRKLKMYEKAAM